MFDTIFGLPMHPLVVHATAVLVPLAAVTVAVAALWPRFRAWAAFLPFGASVVGLILVPISTSSGQELEKRLPPSALIERHSQLADGLLPWAIVLAVASLALLVVHLREKSAKHEPLPRAILAAVIVVAIVSSAGTVFQVGRIGHAGAVASWGDVVSSTPAQP